jgi:hypothetical protein
MNKNAPIIIFCYRREIKKLIKSLLKNKEASSSELFIFSDGFKSNHDKKDVLKLRKTLKKIKGFKSVNIFETTKNKGLANSVISGVNFVIKKFKNVIVLEDDLIVSPYFLNYMNSCLDYYIDDKKIWSISGYGPPLPCLKNYDKEVYLTTRSSSWGWSTWLDRWNKVDWLMKDFNSLKKNEQKIKQFEKGGNDIFKMLELQYIGKIDSWAIRFCYSQFIHSAYSVTPKNSMIQNNGFGDKFSTHNLTKNDDWDIELSNTKIKNIKCSLDSEIINCFKKYHDMGLVTKIGYLLRKKGGYKLVKKLFTKLI